MPDIVFQHVISCSSEDPLYPAKNLLLPNRKWRTKKGGDPSASVIIQLEKEVKINKVDIGNNGSAFVEVLVGKSSTPEKDYEVLLLNSSFMAPSESRSGIETQRVRMFDLDKLCQDTTKQKWDRIKIVCQQNFNPHAQFGLSFIKLQTPAESSPGTSLGRFVLRDEEEDNFAPGSLFAKRKDSSSEVAAKPRTAAAAISDAMDRASAGKTKAAVIIPKKREHPPNGNTPEAKRRLVQESPSTSTGSPKERKVGSIRKTLEKGSDEDESEEEPPKNAKTPEKVVKKDVKTPKAKKVDPKPVKEPETKIKRASKKVPFSHLLKGVTIVLSGFQNPTRGILRDNAVDMGARYKAEWDQSCTHLISAFDNTPKVKQVRSMGNGKIVKKEWIDQCFRKRTRFPWRRFALDQSEQDQSESEEEVLEETGVAAGTSSGGPSTSTVESEEEDKMLILSDDDNDATQPPADTSQKSVNNGTSGVDIYDVDTDYDSDSAEVAKWPPLPGFYDGLKFTLHEELAEDQKKKLRRYITAAKGKIEDSLSEDVKYLVTESKEGLLELKEFYPDVKPVSPKWIWDCFNNNRIAPLDKFLMHA